MYKVGCSWLAFSLLESSQNLCISTCFLDIGTVKRDSLENGRAYEGGGEGEREIIWKRREEVVAREEAEALERQRLADYIVWKKREDFQEKRADREKGIKSAANGKTPEPEVIWKRRDEEECSERAQAIQRGHEIVWRKRERE